MSTELPPEYDAPPEALTSDDRTWAILCHVGALTSYIGVPGLITTLVIWLIKKDQSAFVDYHGKEALNFQITIWIWVAIGIATICIVVGIVILSIVGIFNLVMIIVAAIKASNGEYFRYPLTLRLIK